MLQLSKITLLILCLSSVILAQELEFDLVKEKNKFNKNIFIQYDKDKNKVLSFEEFNFFSKEIKKKMLNEIANEVMRMCDKNTNSVITVDELLTASELDILVNEEEQCLLSKNELSQMDNNKDNKVTRREYLLFVNDAISHKSMFPNERENIIKISEEELIIFKEHLNDCDSNKDKYISLVELTSHKCYMTSEVFLQYSANPKESFKISEVTQAPYSSLSKEKNNFKQNMLKIDSLPKEIQIGFLFSMCDVNNDMKLTIQEAQDSNVSIEVFDNLDYDKNSVIEKSDVDMIYTIGKFHKADSNHNKKIELNEFDVSKNIF